MSPAIVGALACQKNSFLKSLLTTVVSCKEYQPILSSKDKQNQNMKAELAEKAKGLYAVELEDTILFPEGGGQPHDTGIIAVGAQKIPVSQVIRDKLAAVHVTAAPIEVGATVEVEVDWERRIDIMQQHTGQHLLSAVLDKYKLDTLSWSMGAQINYLEVPRKIEDHEIEEIKQKINDLIVQNVPIVVHTPDKDGHDLDLSHIPDDYDLSQGIVRIITIGDDYDVNPCCGTHLSATGQILAVSVLHQTSIRGGNSRLHFVCGARVSNLLLSYHKLLKDVSGMQLSCLIDEVSQKVGELSQSYRKSTSREASLLKELAALRAAEVYAQFEKGEIKVASLYREDLKLDYLAQFQKELTLLINANPSSSVNYDNNTIILINGDYKSGLGGTVKVVGPLAEQVQGDLKKLLSNLKGGGRGNTFQGKVTKYEKGEIENVLNYFESLQI